MTITTQFVLRQYARFWKDLYYSLQVRKSIDRTKSIKSGDVLLLACHNQWNGDITHFCDYYREIGVNHFLFIDYGKAQRCREVVKDIPDVTVFSASGGFRRAGDGYEWRNVVLKRYAKKNFCVLADPGEYLVFPFKEDRKIGDLANFLKNERKDSLHGLVIDAYAGDPADVEQSGNAAKDPFALCPYFDKDGYYHRNLGDGVAMVKGGPSLRLSSQPEPNASPTLNKIVGVWWRWNYYFLNGGKTMRPPKLMRIFDWKNPVVSVALFRFPEIEARQGNASFETMIRTYGKEVANAVTTGKSLYVEGVSARYKSSSELMEIGLISSGNWI
jgi:hypothetical protein